MSMIKRNYPIKNAIAMIKEKTANSNYCCSKCKKCFVDLAEMENHICNEK